MTKRTNIKNIIICGMGGSAIGGDFVKTVLKDDLKIPIIVNRDYDLPNWISKETLLKTKKRKASDKKRTNERFKNCRVEVKKLVSGL